MVVEGLCCVANPVEVVLATPVARLSLVGSGGPGNYVALSLASEPNL